MTETVILQGSDTLPGDRFGDSLAIEGETLVVAAPGAKISANFMQGALYLYTKPVSGWADAVDETIKLIAPDGANGDLLGDDVAISGDVVVAGATGVDVGVDAFAGAVYLFEKSGAEWVDGTSWAKLSPQEVTAGAKFGSAVDISGDVVVVGEEGFGNQTRRAALFVKPGSGWVNATPTANLTTEGASRNFARAVAIDGDRVLVSDSYSAVDGNSNGKVLLFTKPDSGWVSSAVADQALVATDGAWADHFGHALALDGDRVLVSALVDDIGVCGVGENIDQGSAYIFDGLLPGSAPEIGVSGGGKSILNGDTTPCLYDNTDLGVVEANRRGAISVFKITNTGVGDLTLGQVTLDILSAGTTSADLKIIEQPLSTVVAPGEFTEFEVYFTPTSVGLHKANISIENDDGDESPFVFAVQGTGGPGLTVQLSGDYATVISDPVGINCSTTYVDCHEAFDMGEVITLDVVPDAGATISPVIWGGDCAGATGSSCDLTIDDTRNVTVAFSCEMLLLDKTVVTEEQFECQSITTGDGFSVLWSTAPGIDPQATLTATDHVTLGPGSRVYLGGALRVVVAAP